MASTKTLAADEWAHCALETALKTRHKGKLLLNYKDEWTCFAGIIQLKGQNDMKCVAFGTGVKCLPESRCDDAGRKVRDSHAEIICKRNFTRYLLQEVLNLQDGERQGLVSEILERDGNKFRLRSDVRFVFYISTAPCGDGSMVQLEQEQTAETRLENESKKRKFDAVSGLDVNAAPLTVLRGRLDYSRLGVVRTKPGRLDSEPTLSLSCSDKIAIWNSVGIGGAFVSYHLSQPIYLHALVIGDLFNFDVLDQSLNKRMQIKHLNFIGNSMDIHHTQVCFPFSKSQLSQQTSRSKLKPSSVSVSWYLGGDGERITDGLLQGSAVNLGKSELLLKFRYI
jgi:tRNA-specific adenosine deaminase 1